MKEFRCKMMIAVLIICMLTMVGCGNADSTPTSQESSTVETESAESAVESTAEVIESTTESTEESTTEETTTEIPEEVTAKVTEITEHLQLDEELEALLLEDLQTAWKEMEGDTEKFSMYAGLMQMEFEELAKEKANSEPETESELKSTDEVVWDINNLPEDRVWVDDLAEKLIAKDFDAVHEILCDDSIIDKAAPYRDPSADSWDDSKVYRLVTSDGKYVGLRLYEDADNNFSRDVFYSEVEENREFGFKYIGSGDLWVHSYKNVTTGEFEKMWFDGKYWYQLNGQSVSEVTDEVLIDWFF